MKILDVFAVPGKGSYYCEDVTALQDNPLPLEERYFAPARHSSFNFIREPGEVVSVGLLLENGAVAWGDCVGVAYGGKAGRDPVFRAKDGLRWVLETVKQKLVGREIQFFRDLVGYEAQCSERLPAAVSYGVSQALLQATSLSLGLLPVEVICREWDLPLPKKAVPLHAQSGGERYHTVDKMIARRIDSLPHGLVDDIPAQLGERGEKLVEYVGWISRRLQRAPHYRPVIHIDVHGAIAKLLKNDMEKILSLLQELEAAAGSYTLRMESVVMEDSLVEQIATFKFLRGELERRRSKVQLVADEWANDFSQIEAFAKARAVHMVQVKVPDLGGLQNSVEAVLACKANGVDAFLGGSCNETDLSARLSTHVALATQPSIVMAKPGMGVDEGIMLVGNEMARTLHSIAMRA